MSEANSPMFDLGQQDGQADRARVEQCPPLEPFGPTPRNLNYPWMYIRGYHSVFDAAVPHICTQECQR